MNGTLFLFYWYYIHSHTYTYIAPLLGKFIAVFKAVDITIYLICCLLTYGIAASLTVVTIVPSFFSNTLSGMSC